ncbi:MAG: 30S ribosomal protein S17 [Candidatus Levyibacteriota bacterium]
MKKTFLGKVVSAKMMNTVIVAIERKVPHPRYGKLIKKTKRIFADMNNLEVKLGNMVEIEETKPMSKGKNFKVVKVIEEKEGVKASKKA